MSETDTTTTQTTGAETAPGAATAPPEFETWEKEQPEEIRSMLTARFSKLENALKGERENRGDLERQVRDLAKKAEKGGAAEAELTKIADQMAENDRRSAFYEAAHVAGVTNLKLAYTVATQDDLFDRRGVVNFEAMKQSYPELFGAAKKAPPGNAGIGTQSHPTAASMNDFIRAAAGKRP